MHVKETCLLAAQYALYALLIRCIVVYSYRVLLHPLNKIPGPFFGQISNLYGAWYALLQDLHLVTYYDHQKYGDVVRQGPNKLVFNTTTALRDIYLSDRIYKSHIYSMATLRPGLDSLFSVIDKTLHRKKRKVIGHGLSDKSLRTFEPNMMRHINRFVLSLIQHSQTSPQKPTGMAHRCQNLGVDIIGELGFGTQLNNQVSTKNHHMITAMENVAWRSYIAMQWPTFRSLKYHWTPWIVAGRFRYLFKLKGIIQARLKEDVHAKRDLLSFVGEAAAEEGTGETMKLIEIMAEAVLLFPAGSDTTASGMSSLFFYLSRNPSCYTRLAEEIRTTFPTGSSIVNGPTLKSCTYLHACFDEALRMSPPIVATLWRELSPKDKEPFVVDGILIPPGTRFGVNTYSLHHNEKYFPDPFKFDPERWINNDYDSAETKAAKKIMREAFSPFSLGTRGCVGKSMAYMEATLVVAKTLWYLDFERPEGGKEDSVGGGSKDRKLGRQREDQYQQYDHFVGSGKGPNLVFRTRGEFWKELGEEFEG